MTLKVAFQMEPMEETDRLETHTLVLMQEAQDRGHTLFHYEPKDLSLVDDKVLARGRKVSVNLDQEDYYSYGDSQQLDLADIDVVMIRQDPPFNMEYITTTYLLERIADQTSVVNHPRAIRDLPEKVFPFDFYDFMPPTLVTSDIAQIEAFRAEHNQIVIKPLYGFHGHGVKRVEQGEVVEITGGEPIIVQPYLEAIREGNKRVVFLDGEVAGALLTVPPKGEFRIYRDSVDHVYELNVRDKEICDKVGASLKKHGVLFAGIDIIGDYLMEINITSVGSIRRLNQLYVGKFESRIWDCIEKRL